MLKAAGIFLIGCAGYSQYAAIPAESTTDAEAQAEFRIELRGGLPSSEAFSTALFVLNHEEIAIPMLLQEVRAKLGDKDSQDFVRRATELIGYGASDRGIDEIADLCSVDKERFSPLVKRLLNHAINRNRQYEVAYHAVEVDPNIREVVVDWVEDSLSFPQFDMALARVILKRERAGHPVNDDILIPLLPAGTRPRVISALEQARNEKWRPQNASVGP